VASVTLVAMGMDTDMEQRTELLLGLLLVLLLHLFSLFNEKKQAALFKATCFFIIPLSFHSSIRRVYFLFAIHDPEVHWLKMHSFIPVVDI
jgi:hypothetical protein